MCADVLRSTGDSFAVFCYDAIPILFQGVLSMDHGPLLVALDSSIIIDLQDHGFALFEDERPAKVSGQYAKDLDALAQILDLWLLRDIRFIVLPRALSDAKKRQLSKKVARKMVSMERIANALTFQLQDWGYEQDRFPDDPNVDDAPQLDMDVPSVADSVPKGADRELVLQAIRTDIDVFLTRDKKVLKAARTIKSDLLQVLSPSQLWVILINHKVSHLGADILDHPDCPYRNGLIAGDTGKWQGLLSVFG